ncbi:hypothetical protein AB2L27_19625 [Kineococcus sp. LSe6-4]|uniref:Uncharacterized protein n=1 Tax=Kineococcus halophytocola TaxID=3234027 RepID=A0ABV4H961_9ACTN
MSTPSPRFLRRTHRVAVPARGQDGADRHAGTNGWVSAWGTNAHGEMAGCPPAGRTVR